VPLYQVQTVARPVHPDLAQPATRAYAAGMLEQLRPKLTAQASQPVEARVRVRARARRSWLALAAVSCLACAAAAGALLREQTTAAAIDLAAAARPTDAADTVAVRAATRSARDPALAPTPRAELAAGAAAHPAASGGPLPSPRAAAELLARGRYRQALDAYRALAQASPGRPVFAHVTEALARKLARRCERRAAEGDVACLDEHP
jgi:hypothetical protein